MSEIQSLTILRCCGLPSNRVISNAIKNNTATNNAAMFIDVILPSDFFVGDVSIIMYVKREQVHWTKACFLVKMVKKLE